MSSVGSQFSSSTANTQDNLTATYATTAVGSRYEATPQVVTDGQLRGLQIDSSGRLVVIGPTADANAFINRPVGVGGIYRSALPTYTNGQATIFHMSSKGRLLTQDDTIIAALPAALGQTNMAGSLSVAIASDQSAVPVSISSNGGAGATATFTGLGQTQTITTNGATTLTFLPSGTWTGFIGVLGSTDGVNWSPGLLSLYDTQTNTSQPLVASNLTQLCQIGGFKAVQVKTFSSWTGTAVVGIWLNNGVNATTVVSAAAGGFYATANVRDGAGTAITSSSSALDVNLKVANNSLITGVGASGAGVPRVTVANDSTVGLVAGTALVGKVGLDQTTPGTTNAVSLAQVGSTTVATSNGVVGAGVQRVAIASDNTAFSVNAVQSGTWTVQPGNTANTTAWLTSQKGFTSSNAPVSNDYTSVAVTTAAYTQLIASTTSAATFIDIFDSSGQAMILATGGAGSEVILAYVPPGGDSFSISIPASTRVAIKALFATANTGYILMNLRG